jgi:protein-tyrosine phosphatase
MAEQLLRRALPKCRVVSAGIAPPVGANADPRAIRLLALEGLDLRCHRTRPIDVTLISEADLILVMESDQRQRIEATYACALGKTYRICESIDIDVPDPMRHARHVCRGPGNDPGRGRIVVG